MKAMKSKYLSLPMMLFLSLTLIVLDSEKAGAQERGRFRVTLTGFVVNHETVDSRLSIDGAGDEVFALVNFAEIWSSNNIPGAPQISQSLLYGDTSGRSGPVDPRRIFEGPEQPTDLATVFAGSMSPSGGLGNRDFYPPATGPVRRPRASEGARARMIPMTLWEGELRRDGPFRNAIVILPTIWESDNVQDVLLVWHRQADAFIRRFAANSARFFTGTSRRALVEQVDIVLNTVPQRNDFDRPIGMDGDAFNPWAAQPAPGTFIPAVMLLTFDSAQAAANSTTQGRGIVEIHYRDGRSYGQGNYTIFLLVQRLP